MRMRNYIPALTARPKPKNFAIVVLVELGMKCSELLFAYDLLRKDAHTWSTALRLSDSIWASVNWP